MIKRLFDIFVSLLTLILLFPLFFIISILVKSSSRGPVFFQQTRIGKNKKPFTIYKFRSMKEASGNFITSASDERITRIGRFLRKTKLDETPQFFNVLIGDMSLVGPRPEVPRYVKLYPKNYAIILKLRPGITDTASLEGLNEEQELAQAVNVEKHYQESILPRKLALQENYVHNQSFVSDINILAKTLKLILFR